MDESTDLDRQLHDANEALGTWRLWATEVLYDWGGYDVRTRPDAELRTLLALTFGFTYAGGGVDELKRKLRALVAHQQGIVRLTEAILGGLDNRPADGVTGASDRATNRGRDGADSAAHAGQIVEQRTADRDQGAQPKL